MVGAGLSDPLSVGTLCVSGALEGDGMFGGFGPPVRGDADFEGCEVVFKAVVLVQNVKHVPLCKQRRSSCCFV